jgi:prophage maintenance system killer protein
MAAAYLFHIVRNHPFIDGNKRVGTMAAYAFLALNGHELAAPSEVLADFVLALARGERSKADVALFFREHARRPRLCTSIPKQRLKPRARSALKRADPNKISHF